MIGTNDSLHVADHCVGDRNQYLKVLYQESIRIFPKAAINFVLPFQGLQGVSQPFLDELEKDLKFSCPAIRVFRPPHMKNKISRGGIHLNKSGRSVFLGYLRSQFVVKKQRIFSSESGRRPELSATSQNVPSQHDQVNQHPATGSRPFMVQPVSDAGLPATGPPMFNFMARPRSDTGPSATAYQDMVNVRGQGLVQDIAAKVTELLSHQNLMCQYFPGPHYPPMASWHPGRG